MHTIDSRENEKLKTIRRLRRSKGRQHKTPGVLLEGPHLIQAALDLELELDMVVVSSSMTKRFRDLLERTPAPVSLVKPELLDELADADTPRGIVAVTSAPATSLDALAPPRSGVIVFCDRLQDPGNLGALSRSAAAASVDALVLSPSTCHPFHPRALRASAGALLSLPVVTDTSASELRLFLEERHTPAPWLGLFTSSGQSLWSAALDPPFVLAVGAEGQGLSEQVAELCERRVTVPLEASVESLNATVAISVVLFEWRRRTASQP